MPTYVYRAIDPSESCDHCRDGFDILMRMSDPALEACPTCARPIRRVIMPTRINQQVGEKLSDRKIEQLGFSKLVKDDDGKYKKVAGKDIPGLSSV